MTDVINTTGSPRQPSLRSKVVLGTGVAVIAGVDLVIAARIGDADHPSSTPIAAQYAVSPSHCTQFIALAEAKFGADWKYRLDPRDTTCAAQVQQEWEHQWHARNPVEPVQQPTMTISAPIMPPADDAPPPANARLLNPETYCLNVISLARTRYGSVWANKVSPAEAANCGDQIRHTASQ